VKRLSAATAQQALLILLSLVSLYPIWFTLQTALKSSKSYALDPTGLPREPTLANFHDLFAAMPFGLWTLNSAIVAFVSVAAATAISVLAAYAIVRLRFKGADTVGVLIFFAYLVPPSILFIPLASVIQAYGLFDSPLSLILVYPTLLVPFSTWLLMGYFKTIPYELEECALIDGASRWQILTRIVVPLAVPGLISAFIFSFTLCWNEFIYALTFLQSTPNKTVPVAIVNEFVDGDIYRWGSLMAGALVGSLPLVILYAFFVEHYVSAMTGAVKE